MCVCIKPSRRFWCGSLLDIYCYTGWRGEKELLRRRKQWGAVMISFMYQLDYATVPSDFLDMINISNQLTLSRGDDFRWSGWAWPNQLKGLNGQNELFIKKKKFCLWMAAEAHHLRCSLLACLLYFRLVSFPHSAHLSPIGSVSVRTLTDTRAVDKVQIKDNERHPLLGSWELRWKLYFKRHFWDEINGG